MSERIINLACFALSFVSFVLFVVAYSTDSWWISLKPQEFENVGLWNICFNHYRHRFDFYGKIYTGCWWIFSPELRMLFSWLSRPWFRVVQAFATLALVSSIFSLIMVYVLAASKYIGKVSSRYILSTAFINLLTGNCSY